MKPPIQPKLMWVTTILFISSVLHAQNFHMVKDINDSKDGNPSNSFLIQQGGGWIAQYAVLNNIAYFAAPGGLWRSDGTTAGTWLVKNISTNEIVVAGSYLYFSANDGIHGWELWKSDGTEAGTTMVKDIYSGATSSDPSYIMYVNGILFFRATTSDKGNELMRSDGTDAGTVVVKDFSPGIYNTWIDDLTDVQGTLFFFVSPNVDSLRGLW
ncbi:MAG TPA: ELWxxDGT repeat protein, partial [Chitinophagaceae bacterium]|nr:ELWxxDGT repeat protein [Chitinophagaceae bacterium]